jgi:ubiquinone/menaquinone biosynthesis C-methylase UbiE
MSREQISAGEPVLDVGCRCGGMTLQAAPLASSVLGVDISHPLVEVANERARAASIDNVDFLVADAQIHAFAEATCDVLISQFGLMFFDDAEAAFTNLRGVLSPGGRCAFMTWQPLEANDWLMVVGEAVANYAQLPTLGGRARGPGMFALMDADETTSLMTEAGFVDISIEPTSTQILLAGGGTLDETIDFLLGMGIVRGLLASLDDDDRMSALGRVRATLTRCYEQDLGVRLGAAGWLITARA